MLTVSLTVKCPFFWQPNLNVDDNNWVKIDDIIVAVWNISKIAPFGLFLMRKDVTCLQPVSSFVLRCFRSNVAMFQIQHNMCPQSIWAHSLAAQSLNLICIDPDLAQSTLYSCVCLKKKQHHCLWKVTKKKQITVLLSSYFLLNTMWCQWVT